MNNEWRRTDLHRLTFVRVDSLQVHDVADDMVLVCDAVSSQHVSGLPGHVQGFTTAVPLQHGDHLWSRSDHNQGAKQKNIFGLKSFLHLQVTLKRINQLKLLLLFVIF